MKEFSFFFGLCLSHRFFSLTDNLSKTLQKETTRALSSQRFAGLTINTLKGMRNDDDFKLFYNLVKQKAEKFDIADPVLPKKRRKANYSNLQYVSGYENLGTNNGAFNPFSIDDHYKFIYFETLDAVIVAVTDRFEQPSYKFFSSIEQLLLKSIDGKPHDEEKR